MEIRRHEVVFDNNGIPDVYKAGIIRQGSKNVDMLSVRFENHNDMEMVAVLGGERSDGEKVPPGLLFIPEKDEATGYVWYNFIFGQQEDEGNPNSWFTEIDNDLLLNIRLVKEKQVYVDSQIKMEVEYDSGFETGGEYGWNIISGFLEALSMRSTYDYVDSEIEKVITDMISVDNDLQAHKSDTLAHNIPSQIDSKINTHNTNGISHQDLRTGLSEVQSVATDNKNKLDTIEVGATADQTPAEIKNAYESNANTNPFTDSDKVKLTEIEAKAQVNKIETIIVNGIEQAIIEKGVNLTTDIHNMIVEEIDTIVGSSPELLDTLQELANAINNDPDFATTITNEIASKVSKDFNKYAKKTTLTGSEYLVINDNGVIKRVLTDLVRNDKLTAENIPSGKGTTISEELDKKVDIDLIETQLPDNLVYSDDLETVEEPLIQVYNSQLLNGKQESELNVDSAVNSENAMKVYQDGNYVGAEFLNVAHASNASKLGNFKPSHYATKNDLLTNMQLAINTVLVGVDNQQYLIIENNVLNGSSVDIEFLVIPDTVTSIGEMAFQNNQLTSVVIGNSVTSIGQYAFAQNQLTSVVIGNSVTSIGDNAFQYSQLISVVIPDSVTTIGQYAFRDNKLTSVVIGNGATTINQYAFTNNQLTSVVIPDSVTSIGEHAFNNNQLTSVVIGNSVTTIGYGAFVNNQLTSVVIPDSVTTIGSFVFDNNQLTSVVVGNSVTSIGTNAFRDNKLTSVVIPDSVTTIGQYAFQYNQLTEIIFESETPPTIQSNTFNNNPDLLTQGSIYVPDSSLNTYKTATNYVQYAGIIKPISERGGN